MTELTSARESANREGQPLSRFHLACLAVSVAWCLALTVMYGFEWDWCAALTLWPPWFWGAFGIAVAAMACGRGRGTTASAVLAAWVAFLLVFAEEAWYPRTALRRWPTASRVASRQGGRAFRVVSINCCGGEIEAVKEAWAYEPELVLVQEAPGETECAALAGEWYGDDAGWLYGGDTCVLARGVCTPASGEARQVFPYTWAHVRLANGIEVEAVSVHLLPPALSHDLWRLDTWRSTASLETGRRAQLDELAQRVRSTPRDTLIVVGGDFNVPAYDGILRMLRPRLHDGFRERGVGFGNTVLNEFAVSRFDQVWLSEGLRSAGTQAVRTRHSDHRMVVSDVLMERSRH